MRIILVPESSQLEYGDASVRTENDLQKKAAAFAHICPVLMWGQK